MKREAIREDAPKKLAIGSHVCWASTLATGVEEK
jgi:hypothetical protein